MNLTGQLKSFEIILGSGSPRRKSLLESTGLTFQVKNFPTNEDYPADIPPHVVATYLSQIKAQPFRHLMKENTLVITADTIVVKGQQILNKATNAGAAARMLGMLSGGPHEVITGVSITSLHRQMSFAETTRVYFSHLSQEDIDYYIGHFQPFDKAGAYGIQEWIGLTGVEKIEGCYYNVVGLPVAALFKNLRTFVSEKNIGQ